MTFDLISLILNLLLGTGLVIQFLTIRSIRKEAAARAESAKAQAGKEKVALVDNTVATMVETVNKLLEHNQKLIERNASINEENEQLKRDRINMETKFFTLGKTVPRMIQTNLRVIKALEALGVDDGTIKQMHEQE